MPCIGIVFSYVRLILSDCYHFYFLMSLKKTHFYSIRLLTGSCFVYPRLLRLPAPALFTCARSVYPRLLRLPAPALFTRARSVLQVTYHSISELTGFLLKYVNGLLLLRNALMILLYDRQAILLGLRLFSI